jgi:hypothetical protein
VIVSINQPAYFPWLGYFHRVQESDLHIVLDHAQFEKNSFVNRNKVRTAQGWTWLTVPVRTKGRFGDLAINTIEIDSGRAWQWKHWNTLRQCYGKAHHFPEHAAFFERLFTQPWEDLLRLLRGSTEYILEQGFGIRTPLQYSSQMGVAGHKSELVLSLCRAVNATVYLSGPMGRGYLDHQAFRSAGIEIRYHDYVHPTYRQCYPGFESGMSAIDLLFNYGPDSARVLAGKVASREGAAS